MSKLTKIVATIGPASDNPEIIKKLIFAGVNVFRFNMKHADIPWHRERINLVQRIADKMNKSIGILIDLQGPEIRLETRDHKPVVVKEGEIVEFGSTLQPGIDICIPHEIVFTSLQRGDKLLIDDGFFEFEVIDTNQHKLTLRSLDSGEIGHRKGVNLPGKHINLPSLIDDDLKKLDMAGTNKVDFVALSFSRTKTDIEILRSEMLKRKIKARIIAKIESQDAIDHLDELIDSSDGVMVARGDLGIEVPIEELAYWQKTIIHKARIATKPVITATQMLQSMISNPMPTRAEAVDVANAVFDGTDAVMLSGESANGRYPVKAVVQMHKITSFTEPKTEPMRIDHTPQNQTELMVHGVMAMMDSAQHPGIDKIVVFTESGYTARVLSTLRLKKPIIAVCRFRHIVEQLSISYGIEPIYMKLPEGSCDVSIPNQIFTHMKKEGLIKTGEKVLVIHGRKWQEEGKTNTVSIVDIL